MPSLTIRKTWNVNGNLTALDAAPTITIVQDNTGATLVSAAPMNVLAAGIYEYTLSPVDGGTTYTATIAAVYRGQSYPQSVVAVPQVTPAEVQWPHGFRTILNQLMSLAAQITLSPNPNYAVHGHRYSKGEYLEILGRQIEQFSRLNAQAHPFEIVSRGN